MKDQIRKVSRSLFGAMLVASMGFGVSQLVLSGSAQAQTYPPGCYRCGNCNWEYGGYERIEGASGFCLFCCVVP